MKSVIEKAFETRDIRSAETIEAIETVVRQLDRGEQRVCSQEGEQWVVHQWLKKAILLYFQIKEMRLIDAGDLNFFDKIPLKNWTGSEGVRVVPHALVRYGAFVQKGAILMPSYVNIGAYVDSGTMVDTWATVGSCAQIGKNVHLSGGVGIGGILEPLQASPVIIEDDAFIGSRCIIVEGARIGARAVIGAGVTITASTKIIDVTTSEKTIYQGAVPKNAVVIPGTLPKEYPAGTFGVPCALIIGQRSERTDKKTSLNDALRDHGVSA